MSNVDPAFQIPLAAVRVGGDRQVVGFDAAKDPLIESRPHLPFPEPLKPGVAYVLDACAAVGFSGDPAPASAPQSCSSIPVRYDPDKPSSSIQVDQVGYVPGSRTVAFVR
jgi:hypothetical protein